MGQPAEQVTTTTVWRFDQASLRRKLMNVLMKGASPAPDADDTEMSLHRLHIADVGRKFFDKEYKSRLSEITKDSIVQARIDETPPGTSGEVVAPGMHTKLVLSRNNDSETLDTKVLLNELRKAGVNATVLNACIEKATSIRAGAKRFNFVNES